MVLKTIFKSTEGFFEAVSVGLLLLGLLAEYLSFTKMPLGVLLYIVSFCFLFLSKKFRRFIINPVSLIYSRDTPYKITPWNPESETRWRANLKHIRITTSKSIRLKNLEVCKIPVIKEGKKCASGEINVSIERDVGKTTYLMVPNRPIPLDVNFFVSLEPERIEEVDEPQPFLEYEIGYKPSRIPFSFWDSRRIR